MHVHAVLDIDVVALDAAEDVTCLVQLTAPTPDNVSARAGQSLVVVLDRSGSMSGAPIEGAKDAIKSLVRRLAPQDSFGLVVFDDTADVVIPARLLRDQDLPTLETLIDRVDSGGSTDLSAGYLLGLREVKRSLGAAPLAGGTVLIVSDGHANAGVTDPVQMRDVASTANAQHTITSSTLGFGLGYDEVLLEAIARGGSGTHAFAPDVDAAAKEIGHVVTELLDKSVVAALMRITPQQPLVAGVTVMQDLPHWAEAGSVVVNLGDLYAAEERKTLFRLHVPAIDALGTATVADVVFEFTTLPDMQEHTVTVPISVNVVPGDEARNRVPNPVVTVEELLIIIDRSKKSASDDLRRGDAPAAQRTLASALSDLNATRESLASTAAPDSLRAQLDEVADDLLLLADSARYEEPQYSSKLAMQSFNMSSRGRKRKERTDESDIW